MARAKAPKAAPAPARISTAEEAAALLKKSPDALNWRHRKLLSDAKAQASKESVQARQAESPPPDPLPDDNDEEGWRALYLMLPGFDPRVLKGESEFVPEAARDAIEFIEAHVRHHEGELGGQLLRMAPWQRSFVANLFGWLKPDGLTRRFTEALLYVGKKNGKSLLCEGIALYLFLGDGVFGPKVYCAAAKRDQARIIWDGCLWQIVNDEELDARCERYQYTIKTPADTGFLKPISADAAKEDGMNPSGFVLDELHRQPDAKLLNMARLSMKTRRNSMLVCLTTSDADGESVCNDEWKRFSDVRDNPGDPAKPGYFSHMLPAIFEAGPEDDWTTEESWRKANPNLGKTIPVEEVAIECRAAKENPGLQADFRRYRLNQRVKTVSRMFDMQAWDRCGGEIDLEALAARPCVVAIDLASTTDLVAQVALFDAVAATTVSPFLPAVVLSWFWCPAAAADPRLATDKRNVDLYRRWAAMGLLTLTDGDQIDEERVCSDMLENVKGYRVREWAFDPWNASRYTQKLMGLGVPVTAVRQGSWTMNEPLKALTVAVGRGEIRHGGNPILRWMANNAERDEDTKGNWILAKPKGALKIDGIAALATAKARAMVLPAPVAVVPPSVTFVPFRFGRGA